MKDRIDELASLMQEFQLLEGRLKGEDWEVEFAVDPPAKGGAVVAAVAESSESPRPKAPRSAPTPAAPVGTPISSPMMGIFYSSPSPGSPAFVKEGDSVTAGQVVGLIEAMKVFNEIVATTSGTVKKVVAESGALVQPGDVLIYVA